MNSRRSHPQRAGRAKSRGQVMPIFALVVVVLFAATGLAVDAGMAYLTYNGTERAAAAAALAGVPYMPSGLPAGTTGVTPDTTCAGTAAAAACAATARDGLSNGSPVNGHNVAVSVSRYPSGCTGTLANPCQDNKLTVQVTAYVQPTFLRVLGFSDHPVTATDTAFFLPPIALGQPGAQLGSSEDQLGTATSFYFLRSEGYGNPRTEGDAYDPYNQSTTITCQQSITTNPGNSGNSTDVHALSDNLGTDVTGTKLTSDGYQPLPKRGGYDYSLTVPTGVTAFARVYNPAFAPDAGFNPTSGNPYNLHEQDGSFSGNTYTDQYSAMEYTIFSVSDRFDHSSDTPLSQVVVDPLDITTNGTAVTQIVDVRYPTQILSASSNATAFNNIVSLVYHQWVNVGLAPDAATSWTSGGTTYHIFHQFGVQNATSLTAGSYRMRVDMLDYQGLRPVDDTSLGASQCSRAHKGYAIQLATTGPVVCADPGCKVSALDELAVYTPIVSAGTSGFSVPLFNLPADYAGQVVNFYIYDPGDVTGTNSISILNPDDASCGGSGMGGCLFSVPTTSTVPVYDLGISRTGAGSSNLITGGSGDNTCSSPAAQPIAYQALINTNVVTGCGHGSPFFNGRWLQFQLQIPSNYAGGYSTTPGSDAFWRLHYSLSGGTASDTFTIVVNYANSPVHLL